MGRTLRTLLVNSTLSLALFIRPAALRVFLLESMVFSRVMANLITYPALRGARLSLLGALYPRFLWSTLRFKSRWVSHTLEPSTLDNDFIEKLSLLVCHGVIRP